MAVVQTYSWTGWHACMCCSSSAFSVSTFCGPGALHNMRALKRPCMHSAAPSNTPAPPLQFVAQKGHSTQPHIRTHARRAHKPHRAGGVAILLAWFVQGTRSKRFAFESSRFGPLTCIKVVVAASHWKHFWTAIICGTRKGDSALPVGTSM